MFVYRTGPNPAPHKNRDAEAYEAEAYLKLYVSERRYRRGPTAGEQWRQFAEEAGRRKADSPHDFSRSLDDLVRDQLAGAELGRASTLSRAEERQSPLDRLLAGLPIWRRRRCGSR